MQLKWVAVTAADESFLEDIRIKMDKYSQDE